MASWFAFYPYVGGGKGSYPQTVAALRQHAFCHVPQLPGRDGRYGEQPLDRFSALCDDLWDQLRQPIRRGHPADGLVLFGFSMGGLLATEMAVRLQREQTPPRGLVVVGCPPPDRIAPVMRIADLPDETFIAGLAAHGVMPGWLLDDPGFVSLMLPIWRADCAAVESHPRAAARLACPVLAIAGRDDALVPADALAAWTSAGGAGSATATVAGGHAAALAQERLFTDVLTALARSDQRGCA